MYDLWRGKGELFHVPTCRLECTNEGLQPSLCSLGRSQKLAKRFGLCKTSAGRVARACSRAKPGVLSFLHSTERSTCM